MMGYIVSWIIIIYCMINLTLKEGNTIEYWLPMDIGFVCVTLPPGNKFISQNELLKKMNQSDDYVIIIL